MGPVVADLWREEKHGDPTPEPRQLGEAELNTIGYTLSRYSNLTGTDLEILSHGAEPWVTANQGRRPGGSVPLDLEVITRYFRSNSGPADEDCPPQLRKSISAWARQAARRPKEEPARALTRDEMVAELGRIEARLGG